jgi:hypothetical protein
VLVVRARRHDLVRDGLGRRAVSLPAVYLPSAPYDLCSSARTAIRAGQ